MDGGHDDEEAGAGVVIVTFPHQLPHRHFIGHCGNVDLPMDRWFGSSNDDTSAAPRRLVEVGG